MTRVAQRPEKNHRFWARSSGKPGDTDEVQDLLILKPERRGPQFIRPFTTSPFFKRNVSLLSCPTGEKPMMRPNLVLAPRQPAGLADRSDDDLMTLCRGNNQQAFSVLLKRHEAKVFGLCIRYLGNEHLAEEAVQDAFVTLWRLRTKYVARGTFTAYLARVSLNACRGICRKKKQLLRSRELAAQQPVLQGLQSEEAVLQREKERIVEVAVSRLSKRLKEAVILRFYMGLSYAEMGRILGRSEGALRSRVHVALRSLRASVGDY